jgi:urease accessory protein
VIALASSWLIAGWIGLDRPGELPDPAWLSAASFLVLGVLVAADARMPPVAVAALGGAVGALHGLTDGSALAALGAGFSALLGTVTAVVMLALFTAAAVVPLRALWTRIVVRVAGSWLGAVGVLMLGWLAQGTA